ncbi:glycerol-3-phosphate O-acyltransferase [Clavulina sp. PMI_390]|nr:glycerol-3-phosphate O-acyltransferase [Clavulina sp. PMI_390]
MLPNSGLTSTLPYDSVLLTFRFLINIFFREIRPRGTYNIPSDGPIIFVAAPHHNQFCDPILLASEVFSNSGRRISFLTAAASMKRVFVGTFAGLMDSIPIVRAQDEAKPGTGFVRLSPDDPCLVIGVGTKFKSEFPPRSKMALPKSVGSVAADIEEIISDTELRIKREFSSDSGKGTAKIRKKLETILASGEKGLTFKVLPYINQERIYRYVYDQLNNNGCIGIFPEGGSHDRTDLLPLKAGVAIMALGAMAANPGLRVRIVPVGLSYFHAHRFRSRAVVEFGSAIDVPDDLVEHFKKGGDEKRQASGKLLDIVYDGLKTVTVRTPDYDTLMLVQAARRLYKTPGQHLTLGQVVELNRRFIEGYLHFKDEPEVQKVQADVIRYNRFLKDLGLKDHQVPRAKQATWKTLGLLLYRAGLLAVWTSFALPGVILNSPIFIIASLYSRKKAKEALAASSVKVAGRDVLATWKILVSAGFAPILYIVYAIIAGVLAGRYDFSYKYRLWAPFITTAALPFLGYSALKFGEAGLDVFKSLRPLIISLLPGQQRSLNRLKAMREQLSVDVNNLINNFGPKLYEDFDEFRILVPSASVPPSSGTPGVWRRKSGVGAVDAQGNLLIHPLTWVDERLFGWSHSAKRNLSSTGSASGAASHYGTPDVSDDEDEGLGDYEPVIGYLHKYQQDSQLKKGPRSHHTSYADLQQLRLSSSAEPPVPRDAEPSETTLKSRSRSRSEINLSQLAPVYHKMAHGKSPGASPLSSTYSLVPSQTDETSSPPSPSTDTWPHLRRQRKSSLSDGVSVDRIGALSPVQTFKEGTEGLNSEIQEARSKQD